MKWHARQSTLRLVGVLCFRHAFILEKTQRSAIADWVFGSLGDTQLEVREMACLALSGMIR